MPSETENLSDDKNRFYHTVLSIAGSDSSGGAGIQADIKTISALGCYAMTAITALTAQNTCGVTDIYPIPPSFTARQIEAVFRDIGADAVKIGMLYSSELIASIADELARCNARRIVLDPVMVAQSGDRLLQDDAVEAIKNKLIPIADVITPNLPELSVLLNRPLKTHQDMKDGARELAFTRNNSKETQGILIKGGHLEAGESIDYLYLKHEDRMVELSSQRIDTINNHGTGCTLSSAIASFMAKGIGIEQSVVKAKAYITNAIREGAQYRIGSGHGPVHHFHQFWK